MSTPNGSAETRVFRGGSLEELLPQIREELGPEAVITRQREGVTGGIGGFFGKRTVEIEAHAPAPLESSAIPRRKVVDLYDIPHEPDPEPAVVVDPQPEQPADANALLRTLMAQTSPFADELADALGRTPLEQPAAPSVEPAPAAPSTPPRAAATGGDTEAAISLVLSGAGIPRSVMEAILTEAKTDLAPFEPEQPLRALVRRTLADRIQTNHTWRSKRRTIALVGPAGAGRTLTAAKLCHAHASAGRRVAALSLEPARAAMRLGTLTELVDVDLEVAHTPELVASARTRLRGTTVVVVDTPALDPGDRDSVDRLGEMLAALRADETHLLLPADASIDAARLLLYAAHDVLKIDRILVARADTDGITGTAVGLSLSARIPVSFVSRGPLPVSGLHPASAEELAEMVLP